jgi:hypothetical protein
MSLVGLILLIVGLVLPDARITKLGAILLLLGLLLPLAWRGW